MSEPDSDPPHAARAEHTGDWPAYKRKVLADLERHESADDKILEKLSRIEAAIATLNVKAGAWGAIAGIVVLVAALLAKSLLK